MSKRKKKRIQLLHMFLKKATSALILGGIRKKIGTGAGEEGGKEGPSFSLPKKKKARSAVEGGEKGNALASSSRGRGMA